jgi:triacylglycerol lipase
VETNLAIIIIFYPVIIGFLLKIMDPLYQGIIIAILLFLVYWYFRINAVIGNPAMLYPGTTSKFTFDPNATTYTNSNAGFLCEASAKVYDTPEACKTWALANGFNEGFWFINTNTFDSTSNTNGFVAQGPNAILIVWRGTDINKLLDDATDADTLILTTWSGLAGIHEGFHRAYFKAWGQPFVDMLNPTQTSAIPLPDILRQAGPRKIWITGHSLGGALAQICAAETVLRDGITVQAIYTFGQPRVGNKEFAQIMQSQLGDKIFRVVHANDIVPRIPLYSTGYRHYGMRIFYDGVSAPAITPSAVEDTTAAAHTLSSFLPKPSIHFNIAQFEASLNPKKMLATGEAPIMDHLIINYLPLFNV